MSVPSCTNISGFLVLVTRSLRSPSRPIEVSPKSSPRAPHSPIREFKTVVLPAFLHIPITESVLIPLRSP